MSKDSDWQATVASFVEQYPDIAEFLDTWERASGGGKNTFRGHLVALIIKVFKQAKDSPADPFKTKTLEVLMGLAPNLEEDILCAMRFLYYVKAKPVVPDALYDEMEREFINRPETPDEGPLMNPGSDRKEDYSERVKALAFYLAVLGWEAGQRSKAPETTYETKDGDVIARTPGPLL